MISIKINNLEYSVKPGISILEACSSVGIIIPRFCYHELLSVAGNCRICLVEVESSEKPVASCVTEVENNMSIRVDTPFVKKVRENVMVFLLRNHPLDCPICDQGGECDLQDETLAFSPHISKVFFQSSGADESHCGPLIQTVMTRCISCTRCIRFGSEIAGIPFFGALDRAGTVQIGNYIKKLFSSEISGNVVDLCPVGAITSRPYIFKARPWELRTVESIDTTDSLGSNIYIHSNSINILRILPKSNANINFSIISDKARFSFDSNSYNRLETLYRTKLTEKKYTKINWIYFFDRLDFLLKKHKKNVTFFIDEEIDLESLLHIKHLGYAKQINGQIVLKSYREYDNLFISSKESFKDSIEKVTSYVVLIGTNLKTESAIVNTRIRIQARKKCIHAFNLGSSFKENLGATFVHFSSAKMTTIFNAKSFDISSELPLSQHCLIILGSNFQQKVTNYSSLLQNLSSFALKFTIMSLNNYSNSKGISWANIRPLADQTKVSNSTLIANNLSDSTFSRLFFNQASQEKSIWINPQNSKPATHSTLIIPSKTTIESENFFLNQENTCQKTNIAMNGPSNSKVLSTILQATFEEKVQSNYSSHLFEQASVKIATTSKQASIYKHLLKKAIVKSLGVSLLSTYPIKVLQKDCYLTNNLTKNSEKMLKCSERAKKLFSNFN